MSCIGVATDSGLARLVALRVQDGLDILGGQVGEGGARPELAVEQDAHASLFLERARSLWILAWSPQVADALCKIANRPAHDEDRLLSVLGHVGGCSAEEEGVAAALGAEEELHVFPLFIVWDEAFSLESVVQVAGIQDAAEGPVDG